MKQKLGTAAIVVVTAFVLYWLTLGMAVDVMDDYIPAEIVSGTIPDMSQVNYILAFYTLVIVAVLVVSTRFLSEDLDVAWRVLVVAMLLAFAASIVGLAGYPGLTFGPDKWLLAPALFVVLVSRDPGTFMAIEAGCVVVLYFTFSIKKEVG